MNPMCRAMNLPQIETEGIPGAFVHAHAFRFISPANPRRERPMKYVIWLIIPRGGLHRTAPTTYRSYPCGSTL